MTPDHYHAPVQLSEWLQIAVVACFLLVVGGLITLRRRPRNAAVVEPGVLVRSGRLTPRTLRILAQKHGLRTIIDLGSTPPGSEIERRMIAAARELGLTRVSIRGLYGTGKGNPNAYLHALRVLSEAPAHPALVQCAAGADRTGACIALYRHIVRGECLDAALAESTRFGHDPARNPGMHAFVRAHAAAIGEALRTGGEVAGFPAADVRVNPADAHYWLDPPTSTDAAARDIDQRVSRT